MTMLGSLQVSERGDIANWIIPGKMVRGMGGAMDLVASGSKVVVVMEHTAKNAKKLLKECTLPLTAPGAASMVITEKAVFEKIDGRLVLTEVAKESSLEEVKQLTSFEIIVKDKLKVY